MNIKATGNALSMSSNKFPFFTLINSGSVWKRYILCINVVIMIVTMIVMIFHRYSKF